MLCRLYVSNMVPSGDAGPLHVGQQVLSRELGDTVFLHSLFLYLSLGPFVLSEALCACHFVAVLMGVVGKDVPVNRCPWMIYGPCGKAVHML